MAPSSLSAVQHLHLSPAELSYLHASLALRPAPVRPDARGAAQFRPLVAETAVLPATTNGSARVCFADGTEAVVGVKAEVEKTPTTAPPAAVAGGGGGGRDGGADKQLGRDAGAGKRKKVEGKGGEEDGGVEGAGMRGRGENSWLEVAVEIPGFRDDDAMPVFIAAMLTEALLADGGFTGRLWINGRYHWKIYVDILLLSPPLSYPLPLVSLTSHLALLSTRLPKLKSEQDEDPLFDDDWEASEYLYPRDTATAKTKNGKTTRTSRWRRRPPVTLLVMAVGDNILFDPTKEELAVAEVVLAVTVGEGEPGAVGVDEDDDDSRQEGGENEDEEEESEAMDVDSGKAGQHQQRRSKQPRRRHLRLFSVRTIDPPSRLTPPGVPNYLNTATGGAAAESLQQAMTKRETSEAEPGVWQAPRGGARRKLVAAMVQRVMEPGGVAEEVLDGLDAVDLT